VKSELDRSRKATASEIEHTRRLIEAVSKRDANKLTDKEIILYSIYSVMKNACVEVNFTQTKLAEDATLQLHSRCFIAALAELNFYETKLKTTEFVDRLFADDYLEAFFVEVFREFIARQFDVDKEKIVVLDVSRESVAVFWCSFASVSLETKADLSQDGERHLDYCGLSVKKPLVTSLLISEDFFGSKCILEGFLPATWKRFKMNAEFGFEKDRQLFFDGTMEANWCDVYLGMKWNRLELVASFNDGSNLASIVCCSTIENAEEKVDACLINAKMNKILIRCRVNTTKMQLFKDNFFVVNLFDDLRPFEILLRRP
jgi:hypothetical protein